MSLLNTFLVTQLSKSDRLQKDTQKRSKAESQKVSCYTLTTHNVAAPAHVSAIEELTYNILLFEASEITKKDMKKRVGTSTYMKLDSNEPFDTFVAQLLVRIERTFLPPKIAIQDYLISFSIPESPH
jgi:hypothetical protein